MHTVLYYSKWASFYNFMHLPLYDGMVFVVPIQFLKVPTGISSMSPIVVQVRDGELI